MAPCDDCGGGAADAADLCCHGGIRVVERILLSFRDAGASVNAGPGDDAGPDAWEHRVIAGIDRRLLRATTRRGAKVLLAQRRLLPAALADMLATAERGAVAQVRVQLRDLLAASAGAHRLWEPADVALVGPSNAGKSLLANRLARRDAALVSERAGATRDWVTLPAALAGTPVTLLDTAGVRITADGLENAAIHAGRQRSRSADVFLLVLDGVDPPDAEALAGWWEYCPSDRTIIVANKADLGPPRIALPPGAGGYPVLSVSASTGSGLEGLQVVILRLLGVPDGNQAQEEPLIVDDDLKCALASLAADEYASFDLWAQRFREILGGL